MSHDVNTLPPDLPVPEDDGAADHGAHSKEGRRLLCRFPDRKPQAATRLTRACAGFAGVRASASAESGTKRSGRERQQHVLSRLQER
jgi:hypothetical protein